MKIGSRGKYFAKFWEIIEKFQTVVTNRVLGLTSRERANKYFFDNQIFLLCHLQGEEAAREDAEGAQQQAAGLRLIHHREAKYNT